MKKKTVCISICVLLIIAMLPTSGKIVKNSLIPTYFNNILYVGGDGPGNYSKIQDAIDDAIDGDIIFVYDDSSPYFERVILNKSINLVGENRDTTVIDGCNGKIVVNVSADWVNISGFTIRRSGSEQYYSGIHINSNYTNITNNNISFNANGIYLQNSYSNVITHNNIRTNLKSGISLHDSSNNKIMDNNIIRNLNGIYFGKYAINNIIKGNTIVSNKGPGLKLWYSDINNSIIYNEIKSNNGDGIYIYKSSKSIITGNIILNNIDGIELSKSNNNIISDNSLFNDGFNLRDSNQNIFSNNKVNDKPFIYLINESDLIIDSAGQVKLINCDNITIKNQDIFYVTIGIELQHSHNCFIMDNKILSNNREGIYLYNSSNNYIMGNKIDFNTNKGIELDKSCGNTIIGNTISSNGDWWGGDGIELDKSNNNNITSNAIFGNIVGIDLRYSSNSNITDNIISKNYYGLLLQYSNENIIKFNEIISNNRLGIEIKSSNVNTIKGNTISNNENGIELSYSFNNSITDNKIMSNIEDGIILSFSDKNNIIYHNNFINNGENACDYGKNIWDDGKYGNYWSDYKEKYPDAERKWLNGIWDTPYEIPDGGNNDTCPLIMQWSKSLSKTFVKNINIQNKYNTEDTYCVQSLCTNLLKASMLINKLAFLSRYFNIFSILQRIMLLIG